MRVRVKLFATLADYLPPGARDNQVDCELSDGASIETALAPFGLPPRLTHLVLVNGAYVAPAERAYRALHEGDQLAVWPPIAGG